MNIKILILVSMVGLLSSCSIIKDTAVLSADTSYKTISLIDALEADGHASILEGLLDAEESFADACEKIDILSMNNIESNSVSTKINTFFSFLFGEANIASCHEAVVTLKSYIGFIVEKYPEYKQYAIEYDYYTVTEDDFYE